MLEQLQEARRHAAERFARHQAETDRTKDGPAPGASGRDPVTAGVQDAQTGAIAASSSVLHVLSYNIWFEFQHTYEDRMKVVAAIADKSDAGVRPAVVGLQEVTGPQMSLLKGRLEAVGYTVAEQADKAAGYWCAIATRAPLHVIKPAKWLPFPSSQMCRGLLITHVGWPGCGRVVVATSHLESFIGLQFKAVVNAERESQLAMAGRVLAEEARASGAVAAILMGDMNWDDSSNKKASPLLGGGWVDVWEEVGQPADAQFTYDGRANKMLAHSFRNRFDRCFLWQQSEGDCASKVRPEAIALEGKGQLPGKFIDKPTKSGVTRHLPLLPSDHFGLLASFQAPSKPAQPLATARSTRAPANLSRPGEKRPALDHVIDGHSGDACKRARADPAELRRGEDESGRPRGAQGSSKDDAIVLSP
mmetsp:Transcript_1/g.2  ORF Transcript_1/g.2 Transcript_1/m.2 type:complete len:419 (+) Transcript_1:108-1364(+)